MGAFLTSLILGKSKKKPTLKQPNKTNQEAKLAAELAAAQAEANRWFIANTTQGPAPGPQGPAPGPTGPAPGSMGVMMSTLPTTIIVGSNLSPSESAVILELPINAAAVVELRTRTNENQAVWQQLEMMGAMGIIMNSIYSEDEATQPSVEEYNASVEFLLGRGYEQEWILNQEISAFSEFQETLQGLKISREERRAQFGVLQLVNEIGEPVSVSLSNAIPDHVWPDIPEGFELALNVKTRKNDLIIVGLLVLIYYSIFIKKKKIS